MDARGTSRRDFVAKSTALAAGLLIVPRHVLGGQGFVAPSDRLRIAIVGAGGMGQSNWMRLLDEDVVAICDVDLPYVERGIAGRLRPRQDGSVNPEAVRLKASWDKATKYVDFREMLAKERDLDAVVIATPDHTHATIAVAAMRAGKHVYVQKPLCWSVEEARLLTRVWRESGVVAEMGNQGHSMEGTRRIKDWIAAGAIGPVREVHVWTDRPQRYWAQGLPWPGQDRNRPPAPPPGPTTPPPTWNVRQVERALLRQMEDQVTPPPAGLRWDLWLGPVAQDIPYHPAFHPFTWRGWVPFGVGAIGDMGAHLLDQPMFALDLGLPETIVASSTAWGGPAADPASYPHAMTVQFGFGARDRQPPVTLSWYDGGLVPPRPRFLPDDAPFPSADGGGGFIVGEKGMISYGTYGDGARLWPESLRAAGERIPKTTARIDVPHEHAWVRACKRQAAPSAPFDYSARLTEVMLLGLVASRAGAGKLLRYDAASMRVVNVPEANTFLTRPYRAGWELR